MPQNLSQALDSKAATTLEASTSATPHHTPHTLHGAWPVNLNSISFYLKFMRYKPSSYLACSNYKRNVFFSFLTDTVYHQMTVHCASSRPIQAEWHNTSVCSHYSQKKFITSHLQMQKPIDAIIIQNILFVTDGKWWSIFLPNGSDVNLLKHDVVKWQKQRHTQTHTHKF